jgi:GntR family transcriptional regulator
MNKQLALTYKRSRVPLYLQVSSALRLRINRGDWGPGDQIPTLEELEEEYQVGRVTVRQAVDVLQRDGLVQPRQGKGTFVTGHLSEPRWLRVEATWESLIAPIKDNVPQMIAVANPPPFPRLDVDEAELAPRYKFLRSVQSRDGEPFSVASVHLTERIYECAPEKFMTHTALPVLISLDQVKIKEAHQSMVIGAADTETAALLKVVLNAPTMEARCVVVDENGVAIYVGEIVYRGDCIRLSIDLYSRD